MEDALINAAKDVSAMYFDGATYQSIVLSDMLRSYAEHYCEGFLSEKEFCHKFALWQANYDFTPEKETIDGFLFSHADDISWCKSADIYLKHHKWFTEVRTKELLSPIDFTDEDKDDPFIAMSVTLSIKQSENKKNE